MRALAVGLVLVGSSLGSPAQACHGRLGLGAGFGLGPLLWVTGRGPYTAAVKLAAQQERYALMRRAEAHRMLVATYTERRKQEAAAREARRQLRLAPPPAPQRRLF